MFNQSLKDKERWNVSLLLCIIFSQKKKEQNREKFENELCTCENKSIPTLLHVTVWLSLKRNNNRWSCYAKMKEHYVRPCEVYTKYSIMQPHFQMVQSNPMLFVASRGARQRNFGWVTFHRWSPHGDGVSVCLSVFPCKKRQRSCRFIYITDSLSHTQVSRYL